MSQHDATTEMFQLAMARAHFDTDAIVKNFNRTVDKLMKDAADLRKIHEQLTAAADRSSEAHAEAIGEVLALIDLKAFDDLVDAMSLKNSPVIDGLALAADQLAVLAKPAKNLDGSMAAKTPAFAG